MKWYRWVLAFTWELPQTLVALICRAFIKCKRIESAIGDKVCYTHTTELLTAWSLGEFLFFKERYLKRTDWEQTLHHEYGHSIQSLILGPLYLILIALPSVIWNLLSRKIAWCYDHYYDTPWEGNYFLGADKLGKVLRIKK